MPEALAAIAPVSDAAQHNAVGFPSPGFITILNHIVNFYAGVDTEVRDPRGFTALIKAGLQGREECVSALLMHGKFLLLLLAFSLRCFTQRIFWYFSGLSDKDFLFCMVEIHL